MEMLRYFFECPFNQSESFGELDRIIQKYKERESFESQRLFITELYQIIQTKNYALASRIIKKYGGRRLSLEKTEKLIKFLYDKFTDKPTDLKPEDFKKKCRVVFCPVCCPNPKTAKTFNLIEKAMIIGKDMQIFICKHCDLVWSTEDIRTDNAQDYKKFMKSLGLKGLWKELGDIDIL